MVSGLNNDRLVQASGFATLAAAYAPVDDFMGQHLNHPCNNAPQGHYVLEAAMLHLQQWVGAGHLPPHGQPIQIAGTGQDGDPVHTLLDENGNARGGVRSPWIDVPTARLSGSGNSGAPIAMLVGAAMPFDAAQLAHLYPGGKAQYLPQFEASLTAAIEARFILPADKDEIMGVATLSYGTAD
jgi:hypothetical protein